MPYDNTNTFGNLPGPGPGRSLGSKNKKPLPFTYAQFMEQLQAHNFDLVSEYITLYRDPLTKQTTKADILKDLMGFAYAKRRTTEVSGDVTHHNLNISWDANTPPVNATIDVVRVDTPVSDTDMRRTTHRPPDQSILCAGTRTMYSL
jgi:hypothetical protein